MYDVTSDRYNRFTISGAAYFDLNISEWLKRYAAVELTAIFEVELKEKTLLVDPVLASGTFEHRIYYGIEGDWHVYREETGGWITTSSEAEAVNAFKALYGAPLVTTVAPGLKLYCRITAELQIPLGYSDEDTGWSSSDPVNASVEPWLMSNLGSGTVEEGSETEQVYTVYNGGSSTTPVACLTLTMSDGMEVVWSDHTYQTYAPGSAMGNRYGYTTTIEYKVAEWTITNLGAAAQESIRVRIRATHTGAQWVMQRVTMDVPDTSGAQSSTWVGEATGVQDQQGWYSIKASLTVVPGNSDPQLSSGYVTPTSGDTSTNFYYYVSYYDPDGDSPSTKRVYIDGSYYNMSLYSGSASNGVYRYGPRTLAAGTHNYYFYFTDGKGGDDTLPSSGSSSGPSVTGPNSDPQLSNGYVNPTGGDTSTSFFYFVRYYDADGDSPSTKRVYIDGSYYTMSFYSGSSASDGVYYYGPKTLGEGTHDYYFYFTDGEGGTARLPSSGSYSAPSVTEPNNPPQLSSGYVSPTSGDTSTSFYYYVTYYDDDGDNPSAKYVYIDGSAYTMSLYSGSASDGVYRYGPKNLGEGTHNYYFYFTDGEGGTARLPSSGSSSGPSVTEPNEPPELSSGSVSPTSGDTSTSFYYYVTYYDDDGDNPSAKYVYIDGSAYTMSLYSGSASDGVYRYGPKTLGEGNHNYYFHFEDDKEGTVRLPSSGSSSGPSVTGSNNPPQLSSGSVSPTSGGTSTSFYYYVTYYDADGDSPSTKRVYIDGSAYTMSLYSGSASDGVYRYGPKTLGEGNHNYYFHFEDDKEGTVRLPSSGSSSGPSVTGSNNPPQLSSGSVSPTSGGTSTSFYYYVTYYDADGDSPSTKRVYIDGSAYTMSLYSGSASDGVYRYGSKTLAAGSHNYYFYFEDGEGTVRLPSSNYRSGPTVGRGNNSPGSLPWQWAAVGIALVAAVALPVYFLRRRRS